MDIDMLAKCSNDTENLIQICQEICEVLPPIEDGLIFFSETVKEKPNPVRCRI